MCPLYWTVRKIECEQKFINKSMKTLADVRKVIVI
jgi:hypothetical protein